MYFFLYIHIHIVLHTVFFCNLIYLGGPSISALFFLYSYTVFHCMDGLITTNLHSIIGHFGCSPSLSNKKDGQQPKWPSILCKLVVISGKF